MDLSPTAEERALRDEIRGVAARQPAVGVRQGAAAALRRSRRRGRVRAGVAGEARERPVGRRRLAARSTAAAARARSSTTSSPRSSRAAARRSSSAASASTSSDRRCSRTAPPSRRRAGSRSILDASRDLVPAVQRAGRGQRPDVAVDARRTGRRRLRAQRPEGVDELRAVRRLGLVPRPHRSRRAEEQGHLRARRRHARAGRRGAAAAPDHRRVRVQRGVLHRRVRARRPTRRPARRRLAHRELDAHPRAGRESRASSSIHSQLVDELWRLALERGAFDDPRLAPRLAQAFVEVRMFQLHNWRSISRTAKGEDPGPGRQHQQAVVERDEQAPARHRDGGASGRAQPLWRGADDNPGDGAWQRSWLYYQASSIWAGTNEIQRNVIGERMLGLPASRSREPGYRARLNRSTLRVRIPRHVRSMISKKAVAAFASCVLLASARGVRRRRRRSSSDARRDDEQRDAAASSDVERSDASADVTITATTSSSRRKPVKAGDVVHGREQGRHRRTPFTADDGKLRRRRVDRGQDGDVRRARPSRDRTSSTATSTRHERRRSTVS